MESNYKSDKLFSPEENTLDDYGSRCQENNWIIPLEGSNGHKWFLMSGNSNIVINIGSLFHGFAYPAEANVIWPVAYLTTSTRIYDGDGSFENTFKLSVQ